MFRLNSAIVFALMLTMVPMTVNAQRRNQGRSVELNSEQLEKQIQHLEQQLEKAKEQYGANHPSVMAKKADLETSKRALQQLEKKQGWVSLFNGKDLKGWVQKNGKAKYDVLDGTIRGTTVVDSPNSFLCTNQEYSDFELKFDVLVHDELNSGVQIRSKTNEKQNDRVFGPQVEIEASGENGAEAGYVYGEATGRGWLTPKERLKPHKNFKDGEWNSYRILAVGPRIQTWINGEAIEDLTDEEIFKTHPSGFIGLQVHGVGKRGPFTVQWKNIKIREIKNSGSEK